jgi:hypothetical protein
MSETPIELTEDMVLKALQSKRLKDKYDVLAVAAAAANNNTA